MYHQARTQALAGSSFIKTRTGQLELRNQDGEVITLASLMQTPYSWGAPERESARTNQIRRSLIIFQTAGVFGSGWHMIPVNSPQLFPHIKPGKASMRV